METPPTKVYLDHRVFPDARCRLVLIGKTGNGKSSTGNTIMGRNVFQEQVGINSVTDQCGFDETWTNNIKIMVMDTPGMSDTGGRDEEIAKMINTSLVAMHPGPHAIILCLRCDSRFTEEESKTIKVLQNIFGEKMKDHLIAAFVGKDRLGADAESVFKAELQKAKTLKPFVESIQHRYVLLDNTGSFFVRNRQVVKLMEQVKVVVVKNRGYFRHLAESEISETLIALTKEELRIRKAKIPAKSWKRPGEGRAVDQDPEKKETELQKQAGKVSARESYLGKEPLYVYVRVPKREDELSRSKVSVNEMQKRFSAVMGNSPKEPPRETKSAQDGRGDSVQATDMTPDWVVEKEEEMEVAEALSQLRTEGDGREANYEDVIDFFAENPDLSVEEKQRQFVDTLLQKVVRHPEELSHAQSAVLDKSAKSVERKVKKGRETFSLKTLSQCRLM